MVLAVALTSRVGPQFLTHCGQSFIASATTWIQKHWWHLALWSQLQWGQNQCLRDSGTGECKRHAYNPATNSKGWNKTPRTKAPGCLTDTACHAWGVTLGRSWPQSQAHPTACLIAPKGAVRGVSYANMMLPPTKGLFMHSSYLFTLGRSFR